jgi:[ribosomal protein S5]-alanine N-acetyltransferase
MALHVIAPRGDRAVMHGTPRPSVQPSAPAMQPDWRQQLPVLTGDTLTLRELRLSDAATLLTTMTTEQVARFISTPPTTVEGFERFIQWTQRERANGRYLCFAIVPNGADQAAGIFQLRQVESDFSIAEWGFAMASEYWGSGRFVEAANLVLEFAFDVVGVRRLEARSAVVNGRGNGALRKLGAVHEGVLRRSFRKDGKLLDQSLWALLADEWRQARTRWQPVRVH